jgi:hypothetical protein
VSSCDGADCGSSAPDPGNYRVTGLDDDRIATASMTVTDEHVIVEYETANGSFTVTYRIVEP